jgi:hypothetical protein
MRTIARRLRRLENRVASGRVGLKCSANAAGGAAKRVGYRMRSDDRTPSSLETVDVHPGLRSCGVPVPGAAPMPNGKC